MTKNAIIATLAIIAAVSGWIVGYKRSRLAADQSYTVSQPIDRSLESELEAINKDIVRLRSQIAGTATLPARAAPVLVESSKLPSLNMKTISEMADNPETAGMLLDLFRVRERMKFAALLSKLQLSPETGDALAELLAGRAASRYDIADFQRRGYNLQTEKEKQDALFAERLEELLGKEKAIIVLESERNPPVAEQVRQFEDRLAYEASSLSLEQYSALLQEWKHINADVVNEASGDAFVTATKNRHQSLLARAKTFLSPAQTAVLANTLEADLAARHASLVISRAWKDRPAKGP